MLTRHNHNTTRPTHRSHGSVLIMVVVMLALLALMGVAYVQMARTDRLAMADVDDSNIEVVVNATISYLSQVVLKHDIIDETTGNGELLKIDSASGDEDYDYFWTDTGFTKPNNVFVPFEGDTGSAARGGQFDDTWLAETMPDTYSSGDPTWAQISDINGYFLRIPDGTANDTFKQPKVDVMTHSGQQTRNMNVARSYLASEVNSNETFLGVDADGDGIEDSRWTYAPIATIGDTSYVMAVRIIDNSSLLNLNVATALTSDGLLAGGNFGTGVNRPRGIYPTSIDLTRLLQLTGEGDWKTEAGKILSYRGVYDDSNFATPFNGNSETIDLGSFPVSGGYHGYDDSPPLGIVGHWWINVSMYGYSTGDRQRFTINDEMELRYKGGLDRRDFTSAIEGEATDVLRSGTSASEETTYADVVGNRQSYLVGVGGDGENLATSYPAVRHMVTTQSGTTVLASDRGGTFSSPGTGAKLILKPDLIWENDDSAIDSTETTNRFEDIRDRLETIFKAGASDAEQYLGLTDDECEVAAAEFAAAIMSYTRDEFTPYAGSNSDSADTTKYYGLKPLPFLREIYVQAGYTDTDLVDPNGTKYTDDPNLTPDGNFDHYVFEDGSQAVAVEIGNPFDRELDLSEWEDRIRIRVMNGATERTTYDMPALTGTLASEDHLIFYSDPTTAVEERGNSSDSLPGTSRDSLAGSDGLGFDAADSHTHSITAGTLTFQSGDAITIELQVLDADGTTWVTYDRLGTTDVFKAEYDHRPGNTDGITVMRHDANQVNAHVQASVKRDAQFNRFISNLNKSAVFRLPDDDGYRNHSDANAVRVDSIDVANGVKYNDSGAAIGPGAVAGDSPLDKMQLIVARRRIQNIAELGHIHMFGFTNASDGDFPQRFSGTDGTGGFAADRRSLDFSMDAKVPAAIGIPHAAMVMERFTTLSPRFDGLDNDNNDADGLDNTEFDTDGELFVPGMINVNTAPMHILALGAPLPEPVANVESLMESIITYRKAFTLALRRTALGGAGGSIVDANWRTKPGISSIGELMYINPVLSSGEPTNSDENMQGWGFNNLPDTDQMDLSPDPKQIDAGQVADNTLDDAEERMRRFQYLRQVFSTRSDVFTCYVVIRGYKTADFRTGPSESAKFYFVCDRSSVIDADTPVRVLGVYRVE